MARVGKMGKQADEASTQSTSRPCGISASVRMTGGERGKLHRHEAEIHARGPDAALAQVFAQKRLQRGDVQAQLAGVLQQKGQHLALAAKHALHLRPLVAAAAQKPMRGDLVPEARGQLAVALQKQGGIDGADGGAKTHVEARPRLLQRLPDADLIRAARTAAAEYQSPLHRHPSPCVPL